MNSFKDFLGVGFYNPVTIMLSNLEANRNIFRESSNSWSICLQSTTYYVLLKPASTQSNISLEANHNIFRESKNLSIRSQNMAYYMCALLNKWASAQLNINLQETSWQNGYLQCSFFWNYNRALKFWHNFLLKTLFLWHTKYMFTHNFFFITSDHST